MEEEVGSHYTIWLSENILQVPESHSAQPGAHTMGETSLQGINSMRTREDGISRTVQIELRYNSTVLSWRRGRRHICLITKEAI